jgi:hypothetical protein
MQRLTNEELNALESALAKATPGRFLVADGATGREAADVQAIVAGMNALPALLAEVRELRRLTTPDPISDLHKDGNWWLVWAPGAEQWMKCRWLGEYWRKSGRMREQLLDDPTHALPLPGGPEPPAARGEE